MNGLEIGAALTGLATLVTAIGSQVVAFRKEQTAARALRAELEQRLRDRKVTGDER